MSLSYPLILGSGSPRRKELLEKVGFQFEVVIRQTDETLSADLPAHLVGSAIARKKIEEFRDLTTSNIVLCADTVVILDGKVLGKPKNLDQARHMLQMLSGHTHQVITAVQISGPNLELSLEDTTEVTFKSLTQSEIDYYVDTFRPIDKAGAYGIQEWLGYVAVERIEGSYYNVMGLPINRVYQALRRFLT